MRKLITFCAAAVLILTAGSAHADLTNPSFETGNLTGRVQVLVFTQEWH